METANLCPEETRKDQITVDELSKLVDTFDTFYTGVEAWLELAGLYISLYQYASSPTLDQVCCMLTAMQICFCFTGSVSRPLVGSTKPVLCSPGRRNRIHGQGHPPGPIRFFLMTIDMVGDDEEPPLPTGIIVHAWYGVELVGSRFM